MRFVAVIAIAMLLSGCTWVRQELGTAPTKPTPVPAVPKPESPPRPVRPKAHVERPVPAPQQTQTEPQAAPVPAPIDYDARCKALAANRADDAKQLGATPADQTKMRNDTYRD